MVYSDQATENIRGPHASESLAVSAVDISCHTPACEAYSEAVTKYAEKEEKEKSASSGKDFEIQLFNGTTRSGKDSVMLITTGPKMPAIKVKAVGTTDKEVEFCLQIRYQRDGSNISNVRNDISSYPSNGWKKVKMNEEWVVDFGQEHRGGTAYLMCRDGDKTDTTRFYIRGSNPTETQIKDYMRQKSYLSEYWFIVRMTRQESSMRQFGSTGNYRTAKLTGTTQGKGEPLYGPPRGFGLKQLDNWGTPKQYASSQHLWNWKENVDGGVEVIREKERSVNRIRNDQNDIINRWNNRYPDDLVSDSLEVIAGDNVGSKVLTITEGRETFAVNPTDNQRDIYNAMWIKLFNGGNNYHQVLIPEGVPEDKKKPYRVINRIANGQNYVNNVCRQSD
jgi:hypothetical protein